MSENRADPVTPLKNRAFSKAWVYVVLAVIAAVGGSIIGWYFFKKDAKQAEPERASYTRSSSVPVPDDRYLMGEHVAALPEVQVPRQISIEVRDAAKDGTAARAPVARPAPRRADKEKDNPYRAQWIARQLETFSSQPVSSKWSSSAALVQANTSVRDRDLDYLKGLAANAAGSDTRTAQQKFYESAGKDRQGVHAHTRTAKAGKYTLPAGTVIPCVLVTGINTDLPGDVTAQVSENVYDWVDKDVVLIPQGSRVYGTYSSSVAYGQKRAQAAWTRLVYPDGTTVDLGGMEGTDREGYSGFKDLYNSHLNSVLLATALTASFSALGEMFDDEDSGVYINSTSSTVESEVAGALARMGEKIFSKNMSRNPTVVIRPGYKFNIRVNADVPFKSAWNA